jgi:hypothetical protein
MGKDEFKEFVRSNPSLISYVKSGKKTWQDFYEIFNLYGNDDSVWKEYLGVSTAASVDFFSWLKSIDVDGIQNGISSIQRVLGVFQDLANKESDNSKEDYKPRPLYKHFED